MKTITIELTLPQHLLDHICHLTHANDYTMSEAICDMLQLAFDTQCELNK